MVARSRVLGYDGLQSGVSPLALLAALFRPNLGRLRPSRPVTSGTIRSRSTHRTCAKRPENEIAQTLQKNIRFTSEQWERIESAARKRVVSTNQLVIDLAIESFEPHKWPRTETEIAVARASLFTAQTFARDLIAAGREAEVQEIRGYISTIVPDPDTKQPDTCHRQAGHAQSDDPST